MNYFRFCLLLGLAAGLAVPGGAAETQVSRWVYESPHEFTATGDFNGDGLMDGIVVDKVTGRYRVGYRGDGDEFRWVFVRNSGIPDITGVAVGRLVKSNADSVAVTSPDANEISVLDLSDPNNPSEPTLVPPATIGPSELAAIDIPGEGNTPLDDLYVTTIYNVPDPDRLSLMRNAGGEFTGAADVALPGPVTQVNPIDLPAGGELEVASIVSGDEGDSFRIEKLGAGGVTPLLTISGLPSGSSFVAGVPSGATAPHLVFYQPGENSLTVRTVQKGAGESLQAGPESTFELKGPIRQLFAVGGGNGTRLLAIFGEGESAAIYRWEAGKAPAEEQSFSPDIGEYFSGAIPFSDSFLLLSGQSGVNFSANCQPHVLEKGKWVARAVASLGTLDENVILIHRRIMANLKVHSENEMKIYTNTIPGTHVRYVMVPIPGGEFVMGSPEGEPGRKPDEGPQHRVKISPFWMGQCEVTWNEFELFMYQAEERKYTNTLATDPEVDAISDAVTRPTKPYMEMSFGMGKDGYPAIAMTQHAANKYCEWLSAKTGEFYRLPTEAEWEYACRAGTTTAYSFGDDPELLDEYAWYEANSDYKYQKVGTKKPNPWGLYDMHGNVLEWCLDQYEEDSYKRFVGMVVQDPWVKATKPYPHVARGGSWDDDAPRLRSAYRRGSDRSWKMQDPQLPKSIWYLSDATFIGFRIVRPLKVPPPEECYKYWTSGVERD